MSEKRTRSTPVILMMIIIVSKIIGMLRDVVLANYFGTSNISDAYLIASSVPTLLFYFIGHSLSTAYIPMYNKVKQRSGEKEAQRYSNNLLCIALLFCTVIVAFLFFFPNIAVKIFASGFDSDTAAIAAKFIRISAVSVYVMTLINVFGGYLQANNHFYAPAAVSLPRNAVIIISVILAAHISIDILGAGLLIAYVAELLLLFPFLLLSGYKIKPTINIQNADIKETFILVTPIIIGMCVGQVNKIIDKAMASNIGTGSISALSYASILNNAVQEIFVTGIITILFTDCARLVSEDKHIELKEKLGKTLDIIITLLIPASFGFIVLAEPIVKLILARGRFNENSIEMTVGALRCYTIGLTFLAIRDTLVKVFYAYKETKITTATSVIAILINIVLNISLSPFIGINGLAIATSVSAIFNSTILYFLLKRKIGSFNSKHHISTVIKTFVSSIVMASIILISRATWLLYVPSEIFRLIISVLLGILSYFFMGFLLKNSAFQYFVRKGN